MKKLFVIILLFFIFESTAAALSNRESVELVRCDSLSNIWVKSNNDIKRIHLLAFETVNGELDEEINNYVCEKFKSAKLIELEYDITKKDQYNRDLVYAYLDNKNIQEELLAKGYGQVGNITETLKYTSKFCDIQKNAIKERVGIWTYSNIQEKYCNSGIQLDNGNTKEEKTLAKNKNHTYIKYIIMINSGILVLLLLMKKEF